MGTMVELKELLQGHRFGWFGQRAIDCIGLHEFLDFELILCCDYGHDTELVSYRTGAAVVSLEHKTGLREKWSNFSLQRLFDGPVAPAVSAALLAQKRRLDIVAYCSTDGLEGLVARTDGRVTVLAPRSFLKQFFDNKITLHAVLPALGIASVPGHVVDIGVPSFRELRRLYGLPLVVQYAVGASGSHTFFVRTEAEFRSLQETGSGQLVIVSKYIDGPAPNVNAVVTDDDTLLSYPSVQLIGTPECTTRRAGYCGNDFSASGSLPASTVDEVYRQARRIGSWLRQHGYRGFFGVDFVTDDSGVYPVEVNPRFQGSTHVLTQAQVMRDEAPLALAHVLAFLEIGGGAVLDRHLSGWGEPEPVDGAQMILYSKEGAPSVVHGRLEPGIYTLERDSVVFSRPGLALLDCQRAEEFAITCAIPREGTRVEPGAPLLKIQTPGQVLDTDSRELRPWASRVCDWAYDALALA